MLPDSNRLFLEPLLSGLKDFAIRYPSNRDLCTGAGAMSAFLHNLLLVQDDEQATESNIRALHSVKTWVPWMPTVVLGLGRREIPHLVIMAYYEAVLLAANNYAPELTPAFFLPLRTVVIRRIRDAILELQLTLELSEGSPVELDAALDMIATPLAYAVYHCRRIQSRPE
jgi:hypothetical protein